MAKQYLDLDGLSHLWSKLKEKIPLKSQAIKSLTISGKVITYTLADDTTGTITIPDTTYSPAGTDLGLVKSGGDVTITDGVITVNDDSHNHNNYAKSSDVYTKKDVYTKTENDALLEGKVNNGDVYTKDEADNEFVDKTVFSQHTENVYTKSNTYSKTEIDDLLEDVVEVANGKRNTYVATIGLNSYLNSQDETIEFTYSANSWLDLGDGNSILLSDLQVGDTIYLEDVDVPDRWVSMNNDDNKIHFTRLETQEPPVIENTDIDGIIV